MVEGQIEDSKLYLITPELFTERQAEVLVLYIDGQKTIQIARMLDISKDTVERFLYGGVAKGDELELTSRIELGVFNIVEREIRRHRPNQENDEWCMGFRTKARLIQNMWKLGMLSFESPDQTNAFLSSLQMKLAEAKCDHPVDYIDGSIEIPLEREITLV
jgi:hypothetical protein